MFFTTFKIFEDNLNIIQTKKSYKIKFFRVNKTIAQIYLVNGEEEVKLLPFSVFTSMGAILHRLVGVNPADVEIDFEMESEEYFYPVVALAGNLAKLSFTKNGQVSEWFITTHPENKYVKQILELA
jgi:hypothetical protein